MTKPEAYEQLSGNVFGESWRGHHIFIETNPHEVLRRGKGRTAKNSSQEGYGE